MPVCAHLIQVPLAEVVGPYDCDANASEEVLSLSPSRRHLTGFVSTPQIETPATDPRLAELRELHLELDRAVLDTYAENLAASKPKERELAPLLEAIEIPPYVDPRLPNLTAEHKLARERFNDAVLDAVMALNEVRAAQERRGK